MSSPRAAALSLALWGLLCLPGRGAAVIAAELAAAPMITVSGQGEVTREPDHASVRIAIETSAATAAAASQDNARIEKAVREALLQAGAVSKELSTAGFLVQPQWEYHSGSPPRRISYTARNTLRVDVTRLERIGSFIDVAVAAGATRVEDVEFDLKDGDAARREALALAVANARGDADAMARAAGGTLGTLRELSTDQSPGRMPVFRALAAAAPVAGRAAELTDIRPAPIRITAIVQGRWDFQPRP